MGRNCLLARRLVERGVRFVQLYCGSGSKWDAHSNVETNHSKYRKESAAVAQSSASSRPGRGTGGRCPCYLPKAAPSGICRPRLPRGAELVIRPHLPTSPREVLYALTGRSFLTPSSRYSRGKPVRNVST
jgi:hypothetical protein